MNALYPKKGLSKVVLLIALLTTPQIAPPTGGGGDRGMDLGPKTAHAAGIPTIDIGQIFGHLTQNGGLLATIEEYRRKYSMIKDNFKKVGAIADTMGIGSVQNFFDSFFTPIDNFIQDKFDPAFAITSLAANSLEALGKEFNEINSGNNAGESAASQNKDRTKFALEMAKSFFTEPGRVNKRLRRLNNTVQSAQKCIQSAKGNLQVNQCLSSVEAITGQKLGQMTRAIARQTALMAQGKVGSRYERAHRARLQQLVTEENEAGSDYYFTTHGVQYSGGPGNRYTRVGYY